MKETLSRLKAIRVAIEQRLEANVTSDSSDFHTLPDLSQHAHLVVQSMTDQQQTQEQAWKIHRLIFHILASTAVVSLLCI